MRSGVRSPSAPPILSSTYSNNRRGFPVSCSQILDVDPDRFVILWLRDVTNRKERSFDLGSLSSVQNIPQAHRSKYKRYAERNLPRFEIFGAHVAQKSGFCVCSSYH